MRWARMLCAVCAGLVSGGCAPGASAERGIAPPGSSAQAPGEYILTLSAGADPGRVREAFRDVGVIELRHVFARHYLLRLKRDPGIEFVRARAPGTVETVQPNYEYRTR